MVCWLGSGVFGGVIFPERYRSGHNGTDSKSVGGFAAPRGFESLPLRQIKELRILFSLNKPVKRRFARAQAEREFGAVAKALLVGG